MADTDSCLCGSAPRVPFYGQLAYDILHLGFTCGRIKPVQTQAFRAAINVEGNIAYRTIYSRSVVWGVTRNTVGCFHCPAGRDSVSVALLCLPRVGGIEMCTDVFAIRTHLNPQLLRRSALLDTMLNVLASSQLIGEIRVCAGGFASRTHPNPQLSRRYTCCERRCKNPYVCNDKSVVSLCGRRNRDAEGSPAFGLVLCGADSNPGTDCSHKHARSRVLKDRLELATAPGCIRRQQV